MNADGSGLRNVPARRARASPPSTTGRRREKDGTISFYRNAGSDGTTLSKFSVNPDGSGLTRLVKEAGSASDQWVKYEYGLSPDGEWVARHDAKADRLVVVRIAGGAPVTLLDPVAAYARDSVEVAGVVARRGRRWPSPDRPDHSLRASLPREC